MNINSETLLISASALLWIAMVVLASTGHWLAGLYVLIVLLLIYGLLGTLDKDGINLRLLAFPIATWLLMWAAAFALGNHYAEAFAGRAPDFTVLGFHPSFAAIVALPGQYLVF
jgi:hypothetical protein